MGDRGGIKVVDPSATSRRWPEATGEPRGIAWAPDEKHYAYGVWRTRTRLFTAAGLS